MEIEEMLMKIRETQSFWKGAAWGIIGSAVFFAGLITVIYYVVYLLNLSAQ